MSNSVEQLIDQISRLTLLETSDLVKALETKFNVSAASGAGAAAASPAEGGAPVEEEKTSFTVELTEAGPDKIKIIKALRQVKKDLGLVEAKKFVEEAPSIIAESVSKDDAKLMKETLEAAGAKVKLS